MGVREKAAADANYRAWIGRVNTLLAERVGISGEDLADWCSRDAFDSGMSVREAAMMALRGSDAPAEVIARLRNTKG